MRKILFILLMLVGWSAVAASSNPDLRYYDSTPNNPNPGTNYIISLQTGDKSIGGTPYNFWTLGQMLAWLQLRGLTNGGTSISIITNNILYSTNIITTNLFADFSTTLYETNNTFINTNVSILDLTTNNTFVNTNLMISLTTNYNNYSITTNLFATNITSSVVNTTSNFFQAAKGGTIIVTNANFTYATNNFEITTNLTTITQTNNTFVNTNVVIATSNAFFNNTYVTNITVVVGGGGSGLTNLNATPKTLAWWDAFDGIGSIPNAAGFLTNSGTGDIGWSTVLTLTELDAQNAYLTNTFIFITNKFAYPNGDGQLVGLANASGVLENDGSGGFSWVVGPPPGGSAGGVLSGTYPNPGFGSFTSATLAAALSDETGAGLATFSGSPTETNTTIKGNVQGTNALSVTVNRVDITNNLGGFSQVGVNNTNTGTVGAGGGFIGNITGNITGNLTGDISAGTNLIYRYTTNIVGAANFVFGKAYWTNAASNFTFPALTMQDNAAMETLSVWVTNSGAATITATITGVAGAPGHVVPAVFYCTNATVTEIDVSHFGVLWTNACVGKN